MTYDWSSFDSLMSQLEELKKRDRTPNWEEEFKKVSQCPQRQDSTTDQLIDLYTVATKLGFYDAGDVIQQLIMKGR